MESVDGKSIWALRDVSLQIRRGEILGIIGRNGAGKSTLLKVLSRITAPTQGVVRIKGRIASLLEVGTGFHPELTGRENVFLNGTILGMTRAEIRRKFDDIVDFAEVGEFIDTPVKRYSSGMYVRLAFAVAAHLDPDILIVDEVLAVGDMAFQQKCLGKMDDVAKGGRTVIFVSHNMAAMAQLTRRCLVFDHGVMQYDGATAEAIAHYMESRPRLTLRGRTPVSALECQTQYHGGQAAAIVEVGFCERSLDEIPIGGSVALEIVVETWTAQDRLRFGYSVNDATGIAVLSGFSPVFPVAGTGRHLLALTVDRLPLCPGTYSLSVSVGTGGLNEPKREQHSLVDFGKFQVVPAMADGSPVADWRLGWGHVVHADSSVGLLR
jgi:lipopolysaccharide transport system ATP-binding protein